MPSPGEDLYSWSVQSGENGNADPLINWIEHQTRASVNNSARSMMAAHAKNRNLNNGSIVTTGTANAQAFLSGLTYTTIPTNLRATLKVGPGLTNDGSMTLNMDGLGDVLVKTADGLNLRGLEFSANGYVDLLYNGTNWIYLYGREFIDFELHGGGGITSEDPAAPDHAVRVDYAGRIIRGADNPKNMSAHVISSNPTIAAAIESDPAAFGSNVPDGDIEFALSSIWTARANAFAAGEGIR